MKDLYKGFGEMCTPTKKQLKEIRNKRNRDIQIIEERFSPPKKGVIKKIMWYLGGHLL